jgi:S-adenosylmethionine hydrolase
MKRTIALLTDFGLSDSYVGQMKGVIYSINPNVNIIDITHDIQPQNIKQAAFILNTSFKYFPNGTIFVCVVDPKVGSERKAICIQTKEYFFLAPDNGLLTYVIENQKIIKAVELNNDKFHLQNRSYTFHGRDIFAPVAAHLSLGIEIEELGSEISMKEIIKIQPLKMKKKNNKIIGEIIYWDRFGNLISSIHKNDILEKDINIKIGKHKIKGISKTFSDVKKGELLAFIGSSSYLEIGVREGRAEEQLAIKNSRLTIEVFNEKSKDLRISKKEQ